jgi:hypothetical protein
VLNTKGNGAYPEAKHEHGLPFKNSSLKLTLTNFSFKTQGKGFGSLGAYQGMGKGKRN